MTPNSHSNRKKNENFKERSRDIWIHDFGKIVTPEKSNKRMV